MSQQFVTGGPGFFPEQRQIGILIPVLNVNNISAAVYNGPGCETKDKAVHVDTPLDVKKVNKNINMVNHCIFCLRLISAKSDTIGLGDITNHSVTTATLKKVPCAPPQYSTSAAPPLLRALNKIWSHVQKGGDWDWDDDQRNPEQQRSTQFTCFPKICYYCSANFSSTCDIMSQLKEEINKLGVIVRESKKGGAYSWRAELFERTLKDSSVGRQCISDTLGFLGIPQENQCSEPVPDSLETLITEQTKEDEPSRGHLRFHDEGSEDDASSIENDGDTNNDPNYLKEEESEDSDSATQDFDNDPLDDERDSKPELDQLPRCPNNVEMSSADSIVLPNQSTTSRRSRGKRDWLEEVKIHQQKEHTSTSRAQEMPQRQQQRNKSVCGICGKTLVNPKGLRLHIKKMHTTEKVEKVHCDLCRIRVPRKDLFEHVCGHVGEEYLFRCPNPNTGQCYFVSCTHRALRAHLQGNATCRTATLDVNEKYLKRRDAYICQVCGEDLVDILALRSHLNDFHEKEGRKEFLCPIQGCPQRFSWRQSVVLHIPLHVSELKSSSQPCDVCKVNIKCEEMEQHLKETHLLVQEKIIKCFQCPFLFSDRGNLVDHLYEHRHMALFCDICGNPDTTFYKHHDLRRHYFEVHQIGSKFLCEHCQREYFSARGLEEHVAKQHPAAPAPLPGCSSSVDVSSDAPIEGKTFKCDECDVTYKSKQTLTRHKTTIHRGKLLPCKFCDQKFSSVSRKYDHERKHRRGPTSHNQVFPCQVTGCGKEFLKNTSLKNHIAWAHEGQNVNVCDQCGKSFPYASCLKSHIQSVHMGVRNQVCDVCGESFYQVNALKRHKLIHTGDRPFACQLCGQKFRHKEVLKKHVETHERKGADFKPNGPMKHVRKRVDFQSKTKKKLNNRWD